MDKKQEDRSNHLYHNVLKPYFNKHFKIRDDEEELAFYFETDELMVGVFGYEFPNYSYNAKILAEHKTNFDKWSKAFYSSDFPHDKIELKIIMSDLEYISNKENEEVGDKFSSLHRTFL